MRTTADPLLDSFHETLAAFYGPGSGEDLLEEDRRFARALGLPEGAELPRVSGPTLQAYHRFLEEELSFPFEAETDEDMAQEGWPHRRFEVTALAPPEDMADPEFFGLFCQVSARAKITSPFLRPDLPGVQGVVPVGLCIVYTKP